jgi:hypothetical protein
LASANEKEDITLLEVVWYETFNDETSIPTAVEGQVLQDFFDQNGRLPMECSILEHFILYIIASLLKAFFMQKSKIFIGFTKGLHLHPLSRISL